MQIREHAEATPRQARRHPASVGKRVRFAEMEARANRLAHHFRRAGVVEGDTVAVIMENNEHLHAVMWAARRSGLYYTVVSTHLTPPEAALHRRQQRRQGRHRFTGDAQGLRGTGRASAEWAARSVADRRRRSRRLAALPRVCGRRTGHPDRRRDRGRPVAVLVGNDRTPQGNSPRACRIVRPPKPRTWCRRC